MKAKMQSSVEAPRMETYKDVFEALYGDDPGKAAAMKLRSDALMHVRACVSTWGGTQAQKAKRLQITQPRLNLLMRSSDPTRFQLDDLVALSARAGAVPVLSFQAPASMFKPAAIAIKSVSPTKSAGKARIKSREQAKSKAQEEIDEIT